MEPKYFNKTRVGFTGCNSDVTGRQVRRSYLNPSKTSFLYDLVDERGGGLTHRRVPEDQLIVELASGDHVELWATPGRIGKVISLHPQENVLVQWEDGTPPESHKRHALRTVHRDIAVGTQVMMSDGPGVVTNVRTLNVTIEVQMDARHLVGETLMMATPAQLQQVLSEMDNVDEARVVEDRKLIATVVSRTFQGQDVADRQEVVWRYLRSRFEPYQLRNIEFVFTYTPEEDAAAEQHSSP